MEHKDHFYTITEEGDPKWVKPDIHPIILICHDESTYKSGEICAKRWIVEDNAPFYNKGRGRRIMASDFLVMHSSAPFFSLNCNEFKEALEKYPDLNNDTDIIYEERTASATLNIGGNSYFNNETILKQFERLFQLLRFKEDYKDHDFVCLVDNARTHTAAEYTVDQFAMKPGGRCPVSTIEYVDNQNVRRIINCYDHDGESKGLLKLANELNLHIPRRCIVGAGMLAGFDKLVQVYTNVKVDTSGGGG
ncbi:unnamed protein product [Rotaria sordida]|uniref:Uncharacterized protein n=1 Tax=Rotaria sordida TaxID=392033 RepID=A0A814XXP0_9BILA|nr:unnamed protein product [Rotaria sordida]